MSCRILNMRLHFVQSFESLKYYHRLTLSCYYELPWKPPFPSSETSVTLEKYPMQNIFLCLGWCTLCNAGVGVLLKFRIPFWVTAHIVLLFVFTGGIPVELAQLVNMKELKLSNNKLTGRVKYRMTIRDQALDLLIAFTQKKQRAQSQEYGIERVLMNRISSGREFSSLETRAGVLSMFLCCSGTCPIPKQHMQILPYNRHAESVGFSWRTSNCGRAPIPVAITTYLLEFGFGSNI